MSELAKTEIVGDLPRNAGMNKQDIKAALAERLELMARLGGSAILEDEWGSEGNSDDSEDDEDEPDQDEDEDEEARQRKRKEKKEAKAKVISRSNQLPPNTTVDCSELQFGVARAFFSGEKVEEQQQYNGAAAGTPAKATAVEISSLEPLRRLPRIKAQVEALEGWTQERKAPTCAISKGMTVASDEANVLARQTQALRETVQAAMSSVRDRAGPEELSSHAVWLPASEVANTLTVNQLVAAHRTAAFTPGGGGSCSSSAKAGNRASSINYEFDGNVVAKSGGWLGLNDGEKFAALADRVQRLKQILGSEAVPGSPSLAGATVDLQNRLNTLHRAFDSAACDQLRSSVQLLTCDIDVAIAEAKRLDALEAEDQADDIGFDDLFEDMPAERVLALHAEAAGLDVVASRITDVDRHLASQEHVFRDAVRFAEDLAGAEQRLAHTRLMLERTLSAAQTMKNTVESNKEELKKSAAVLEAKIADRMNAKATVEAKMAARTAAKTAVEGGPRTEKQHRGKIVA